MSNIYGKREINKTQLKIELMNHMIESLADHAFDQVKVTKWCEKANVSEVTFFKYFEKKEELLQFYMLVWNYEREIKILSKGRRKGLEGIKQIFIDLAETQHATNILNSLGAHLGKSSDKSKYMALSPCDKWVLNKNKELPFEPIGISEQFALHLEEAVKSNELDCNLNIEGYISLLNSIFYGTPIIAFASRQDLKMLYLNHIALIFD